MEEAYSAFCLWENDVPAAPFAKSMTADMCVCALRTI